LYESTLRSWMAGFKTLYKTFRLLAATLALLAFQKPAYGPPVAFVDPGWQCLVSVVWHEARGEPVKGKRAVLDVVLNRAKMYDLTYCEVVAKKQQFPWFKKKGLVPLTPETLRHYNEALEYGPVLENKGFIYFNGVRPHGVGCQRIGKHTFCKEKT
jgi:hypothetical protein